MDDEHVVPVGGRLRDMPEVLPFDRCLEVIGASAATLADRAAAAGLDVDVPTCPRWQVADLVAHQGMVHRWAASNLRRDGQDPPSKSRILEQVPAADLLDWFDAGARELLAELRSVAADVPAMVFLNDSPAPRHFWARRQAHETTVHAVDAVAAALGRFPVAAETAVEADVALDGIDELLTGFLTRGRSKLADLAPLTLGIHPTDSDRGWTLHVAETTTALRRRTASDATFSGSAAQLYLGLWNRGDEIVCDERPDILTAWRRSSRVRWG